MRSFMIVALFASGCCFGWSALNGELRGQVLDAQTGEPIAGVTVNPMPRTGGRDGAGGNLPDAVVGTTDARGRFAIEGLCLYDDREIAFHAEGYELHTIDPPFPSDCGASSAREVTVRMVRSPP